MFATLIFATLLSFLTARAVAGFNVVTPKFTQCAPAHFNWDNTAGPYNIIIANSSDPCGDSVADLGDHNDNSATWNVTVPAGWTVVISIEDSQGDEAWSGPITVQHSDDNSCLPRAEPAATHPSSTSSHPHVPMTPSSYSSVATSSAASSSAASSGAANAEQTPKTVSGINGALSARWIPAPAILLGTIGLAFTLAL
ncbi:hypothetical protein BJV78DRAFT_600444 [Lactifluus subvellereus]|nr:hypothetical protein BJV78DRAFT_600444 [Lactifluus subvellereus]